MKLPGFFMNRRRLFSILAIAAIVVFSAALLYARAGGAGGDSGGGGYSGGSSGGGDVPYEERYTIGGDTTLRGYDDDRYRGEDMMLGNFELRIPMEKAFSFVVFYDIGRAWSKNENISWGSDMGSAPGFGVRLNTPLGNLRLDYASGEDDKFHFGFGELF